MVKWGFGASVRVEIILRGADRSVLARNIESGALRPCQVAREAEISKKHRKAKTKSTNPGNPGFPSMTDPPLLVAADSPTSEDGLSPQLMERMLATSP